MTDSSPKPKRRRWRWLVAGVLLLAVVGLMAWRMLFSSDPRFIGKWQIIVEENGKPVVTNEVLWYHDDGTCHQYFGEKQSPGKMRWWVAGDEFVIDSRRTEGFERLKQDAIDLWTRLRTGQRPRTGHVWFTLVNVTKDEVTLRNQQRPSQPATIVRNRRLPE